MKILLGVVSAALAFAAAAEAGTVILSETEALLNVDINPRNLKWSRADYSMPVVKVLVPELADVTILDHRNTGEGAPCLATYEAKTPEQVIQGNSAVEKVPFKIRLEKHTSLDSKGTTCHVYLVEKVEGQIRGFKFEHDRSQFIGNRHPNDCR